MDNGNPSLGHLLCPLNKNQDSPLVEADGGNSLIIDGCDDEMPTRMQATITRPAKLALLAYFQQENWPLNKILPRGEAFISGKLGYIAKQHCLSKSQVSWQLLNYKKECFRFQTDGSFLLCRVAWLSQAKTRPEAHPTCTYSGAAQTGGWTFFFVAKAAEPSKDTPGGASRLHLQWRGADGRMDICLCCSGS